MKRALAALPLALAAACAPPQRPTELQPEIAAEMARSAERKPPARTDALERALLPPVQLGMPSVQGLELESRFDLSVTNAPAQQVFMSLVAGTRYSMLVHPGVAGTLSLNLKDVSVEEALSAIRELYGYDYKVEGARIFVQPAGLQTRMFQVSYLSTQRRGMTEVRVQSGAVTDATVGAAATGPATTTTGAQTSRSLESARVRTDQQSDFWVDLRTALVAIVGSDGGRSVVVSPQSGVVVVRALPAELRAVENYLTATRISVERQVMLEAKIVEVTLSEAYRAGINWAIFHNSGSGNAIAGQLTTGTAAAALAARGAAISGDNVVADTAARRIAAGAATVARDNPAGAVFGLALQTSSFAALITFLESQGDVQVLSSPRLATLNNQKAVLKVGTDEFFVTNVSTTSTTTGVSTVSTPTVTVQPFFSGIVLDVTPQIDTNGNIILHIHPSVSEVTESTRVLNLGSSIEEIVLPLARSQVNETDTIVRVADGNIVAIGGLMSVDVRDFRGGIPGVPEAGVAGALLRNAQRTSTKKELVILLKPTVIQSDRDWEQDLKDARSRLEALHRERERARRPQ
ncbi:MAG TPA: secretin N-terminal domain-containing protein [Burkholderiales bacterium]|nr:secretin N-terminal domain-containing protein [Burkholderiales bacterium]